MTEAEALLKRDGEHDIVGGLMFRQEWLLNQGEKSFLGLN